MKTLMLTATVTSFLFFMGSCKRDEKVSKEDARNEILQLHYAQRDYHFNKDSIAFLNQLSNNFISVDEGEISKPENKDILTRYHKYFSSVEFVKWDDVTEPIISLSEDGTMAYSVVDKIVEISFFDEDSVKQSGSTHFAWVAIYRKYGEQRKIECVASTERPNL